MGISRCGRVGAVLACILIATFGAAAVAADRSDAAVTELQRLATQIYDTTQATQAAHATRKPLTGRELSAATDVRQRFDALRRDATVHGFAADANFARKAGQIARLLANLERAQKAGPDESIPRLLPATPAADQIAHVRLDAGSGANCASAITIAAGRAVATTLASSGAERSTLWLRIAPDRNDFDRLDTTALPLDTEITLFGATCPASDAEALMHDDDAFGLGAALTIDTRKFPGAHYARIRNLGGTGDVLAQVQSAGAIAGRIVDERNGQPLINVSVQVIRPDGYYSGAAYTSDGGFYLMAVDPGSYYVLAGSSYYPGSFIPELYPDTPCLDPYYFGTDSCPLQSADLLTLADGQEISGIDFALNVGATIAGVVREAETGNPLADAAMRVFDSNGNGLSFYTSTDVAGRYVITGLLTGSYFIQADANGRGSQRWDHVTCGGDTQADCQPLDGTPLAVVRNQQVFGIDFDLPREASIHAVATAFGGSGAPVQGWQFNVYDLAGNLVTVGYTYGGNDAYTGPLAPGSYRIAAFAYGYFGQVWNGIDCPTDCSAQLPSGAIVTVDRGQQAEIAFVLRPVPVISGRVTDTMQHPLADVSVGLVPVDSPYGTVNSTYTLADGSYQLLNTPPGEYYVWANSSEYRGTIYPDGVCPILNDECDLSGATTISLDYGSSDQTGIDFALPANGSISGHLALRVPAGMSLPPLDFDYESVTVVDGNGNYISSTNLNTTGVYAVVGIPAGIYYAVANGYSFSQVWQGIDCTNCDPLTGAPINVAQGQNVTGIDFDPVPTGYVFGHVSNGDGAPLGGVAIDLWNANDSGHCGIGLTNSDGDYAAVSSSVCYNGYRVSTDTGASGYENQVFDDIPCPAGPVYLGLCSLDAATILDAPQTPSFVIANFTLTPRPDAIFSNGFDP